MKWIEFKAAITDSTGGNPKIQQSQYFSEGTLPIIDQGKQFCAGFTNNPELKYQGLLPCIVFGDHTKAIKYVDFDFALGADGIKVLTASEDFNTKYLYYFLQTVRLPSDLGYSRYYKYLKEVKVPFIPISEQRKSVEILDAADKIRLQRQQSINLIGDIIRSIFFDMFGDPLVNQRGWSLMKIEELALKSENAIKAGPFGSSLKKEYYSPSGYKIYGQEQVIKDDFNYGQYFIEPEKYQELINYSVKEGDILISLVGSYGKVSIVPQKFHPGIINPRLMKISLNQKVILPRFFKILFETQQIQSKIRQLSHGGTMGIINVGIVRKVKLAIPPIDKQIEFLSLIEKIDKISKNYYQHLALSNFFFDSLLNKCFSAKEG